jgi:hypothetical protein
MEVLLWFSVDGFEILFQSWSQPGKYKFLECATACDEVEDEDDDGEQEEEMNPCAEDMKSDEANQPE